MDKSIRQNYVWLIFSVSIIACIIGPASAEWIFDPIDKYDFYGGTMVAFNDLHLPLQGEESYNCPITDGVMHVYLTDISTSTAFPWKGYSSAGWEHFQVSGDICTVHYQIETDLYRDDPDYWYFHLDPPKGYIPVSAHPLNAYGKALDSQTIFYDYNNLPVGDYSFMFQVKRDPNANQASFTQAFTGSPPEVTVTFDAGKSASSLGPITNYTWYFGDRATGFGKIVKHKYLNVEANSSYVVTLVITDKTGYLSSVTQEAILFPSSAHVRAPPAPELMAVPEKNHQNMLGSAASDINPDVVISSRGIKTNSPMGQLDGKEMIRPVLSVTETPKQNNPNRGGAFSIVDAILSIPSSIVTIVNPSPDLRPETGIIVNDQKIQDSVSVSGIYPPPDVNGQDIAGKESSEKVQAVMLPGSGPGSAGSAGSGSNPPAEIIIRDAGAGTSQVHMIENPALTQTTALPPDIVMNVPTTSTGVHAETVSPVGIPCPAEYARCSGMCTDLMTDSANCGSCNSTCASGTTCASGVCTSLCSAGRVSCNGACVNLMNEASNCGSCGHACISGVPCTNGQCVAQVVTTAPTRLGSVGKPHI